MLTMFEPRKPKRKTPEANLQARVMKYLRHEQTEYLCALTNSPHAADAGYPDVSCISPTGVATFIELKKPKGGIQSPQQKRWQAEIEKRGGKYILARSLKEVVDGL